jgi:hypothetical protein
VFELCPRAPISSCGVATLSHHNREMPNINIMIIMIIIIMMFVCFEVWNMRTLSPHIYTSTPNMLEKTKIFVEKSTGYV